MIDAACSRARAAETRLPLVVSDLDAAQVERDHCRGELAHLKANPPQPPVVQRTPWWLRVALDVAIGGGGVATGVVLGSRGAPEVVIGVGVAAVGLLGVRLLVEYLDDRAHNM